MIDTADRPGAVAIATIVSLRFRAAVPGASGELFRVLRLASLIGDHPLLRNRRNLLHEIVDAEPRGGA
jgi:hypothetical protein